MAAFQDFLYALVAGGAGSLAAYLAAHVLLCLLPAFFIAGAIAALVPEQAITRFLGRGAPRSVSYPAAAAAGSLLAVCSCTIVPLFAGIHRKGAGLGPAITFLFFAPAANILALVYTGTVLGGELAFARLVLSLVFGIGIGLAMAAIFNADDRSPDRATDGIPVEIAVAWPPGSRAFLLAWIVLLIGATLKLDLLTRSWLSADLPLAFASGAQGALDRLVPFEPAKGEEGVSIHGAVLILLVVAIGYSGWRGFETIHARVSGWTRAALALVAGTLLFASLSVQAIPGALHVGITGKFAAISLALGWLYRIGHRRLADDRIRDWIWESWRFAKQIFPLLVVGVFVVGALRTLIRPEWIEALAGTNSVAGNVAGVAFGVVMYFPTLVEVPVARMFLDLGMHRGPLLAYLMADPELSLQSIVAIAAIVGKAKAATYVGLVALFSAAAGWTYGAWIDGLPASTLALSLATLLALLAMALRFVERRSSPLQETRHARH